MRISALSETMIESAVRIYSGTIPSAKENKSLNNNINTHQFYFGLRHKTTAIQLAKEGHLQPVLSNFVQKFQFPNPREKAEYVNSCEDGIMLAPLRVVVQLLYKIYLEEGKSGSVARREIVDLIFYNSAVAKQKNPDIDALYESLKNFRHTSQLPSTVTVEAESRFWNQGDRQLREMLNILQYLHCGISISKSSYSLDFDSLSEGDQTNILNIVGYNDYWEASDPSNFTLAEEEYQKYLEFESDVLPVKESLERGTNIIVYGVPGCGKSHFIANHYDINDNNSERVVFHPDYTYSDFVGQILPQVITDANENKHISYDFVPGPLTRVLDKARKTQEMQYLVIEELNRGNAPAVFGDIFQLLDRNISGESEYAINQGDISLYLYGTRVERIKIPSNLSILATMNTADQNVFTLDTAFKRRWMMKAVRNRFLGNDHCMTKLCGTDLTWYDFATKVNVKILEASQHGLGNEDKRLGVYFLKESEMGVYEIFSEKVLMYLWNDVFKFDKTPLFLDKYKNLQELLDDFSLPSVRFAVFQPALGFHSFIEGEGESGENDEEN